MKVLQVNCTYRKGSTGKIVYDIHEELRKREIESVICYGRGQRRNEQGVYKTCGELYAKFNNLCSRFTGIMYGGCGWSTWKLCRIIEKENPDIVHLHCINGYFVNIYRLLEWLKKKKIKTVLTLHAEFMYTGSCGYALECDKWKEGCGNCPRLKKETQSLLLDNTHRAFLYMQEAFHGFDKNLIVASVSPWLYDRAGQSPILRDKHHRVVLNGIDTEIFRPRDTMHLKQKHGIRNEKVIFHATASFRDDPDHLKGGYYVIELAKRMKDLPVRFIVAGNHNLNGDLPDNVELLGRVEDQQTLAEYYSLADITLMTSKKETFSMPCAESLCCGTPVVGFKAGAPEQIALAQHSAFVPFGDIDSLERCVKQFLFAPACDGQTVAYDAQKVYSKAAMADSYIDIYRSMLK